jgi:hypothetical protein
MWWKTAAVSPIEAPPKMTQKHWENLVLLDARALTKEECASLREVADNVKAQASGQRVVVNPETHATIPKWQIDRVKALIIDKLWPTSPPVNDAVFLELKGMFAGWLSHNSPEETR